MIASSLESKSVMMMVLLQGLVLVFAPLSSAQSPLLRGLTPRQRLSSFVMPCCGILQPKNPFCFRPSKHILACAWVQHR